MVSGVLIMLILVKTETQEGYERTESHLAHSQLSWPLPEGTWAPSDSPFPALEATAGEQVLGRHLHVLKPIAADADPVRNGFHSPKRLQKQAPLG